MQYVAQEALVAPAREKPALWRLFIGLILVVLWFRLLDADRKDIDIEIEAWI